MSRTDLDAATLANALRRMAGDGSVEWVMEPMQASVLLDVADLLDENARLRELATYALKHIIEVWCEGEGRDLYRGKPCEDCADAFSSDCPKCMPRMFDVSGIEVDA